MVLKKVNLGDFVTSYKISEQSLESLKSQGVPNNVLDKLEDIKNKDIKGRENLLNILKELIGDEENIIHTNKLILNEAGFVKRIFNYCKRKNISVKNNLYYNLLKIKSKNGFFQKNIQGSKMILNLRDEGISKELVFNDIREAGATNYIYRAVKKDDVVIDIGANIGYYALMEARLVGDNGKIYAIEPAPQNFEILKKNISINGYKNIEVFNFAIGDKNGIEKLYISNKSNWHSMVAFDAQGSEKTIDVTILTIDTFLKDKKYPALIRMDVEGYEDKIIRGMIETLKKDRPLKLFIEIHPHIMKKDDVVFLFNILKQYKFEITMIAKRSKCYNYNIDYILNNESILNGSKGAFQIFFERV